MVDDKRNVPHLTVIEGSGEGPDKTWAKYEAERALLELAANVLRVVRGAGQPYSIFRDCARVLETSGEYQDAYGRLPDPTQVITFQADEPNNKADADRSDAIYRATRGALQYCASRMLDQIPQTRAGETELTFGARDLAEALQARRRRLDAKNLKRTTVRPRAKKATSAPAKAPKS